jgi:hypothetical protein
MHDSELTYQVVILQNSVMLGKVYCGESVSSFSRHCWMLRVRSCGFFSITDRTKIQLVNVFWFVCTAFVLGSSDTSHARFLQF